MTHHQNFWKKSRIFLIEIFEIIQDFWQFSFEQFLFLYR